MTEFMPPNHSLNASLTEQLIDFIEEQVRCGRYRSASEVVRAGLRLLQDSPKAPSGQAAQAAAHDPVGHGQGGSRDGTIT
jgi:putative addiction module CopG family antidote